MLMYNFFNKTHFLVYFIKLSTELQKLCLQNLCTSKIVCTELTEYIYGTEPGEQNAKTKTFTMVMCMLGTEVTLNVTST